MIKINCNSFSRQISGSAAIEFAFIAPIMIFFMFGVICFSVIFSIYNSIEQIAAEAARAGLAGLSATEQNQLAIAYVSNTIINYPFLNVTNLTITTSSQPTTFQVTASYDMTGNFFWSFGGFMSSTSPKIARSAAIQLSGF